MMNITKTILPIQLEYWNIVGIKLKKETLKILPIQLEYWNSSTNKNLFKFLWFYRYNWSIETEYKFYTLKDLINSTDTIGVLKLFSLNSFSFLQVILPIQLEYWNYSLLSFTNCLCFILPIQLEYWNVFFIKKYFFYFKFYRYNWSIETK